ncbi:hypothetical protein AAF712_007520 [Marasmius tenuissimus]|uniref:Uncharacterized protein n=1 Tax=Marasmius tenuissimus TaxID=585030 RepID=A0ABR2ZV45_9AGAR
MPRIEDDTLLHLVFNELARDRHTVALEEDKINEGDGDGIREIIVVLVSLVSGDIKRSLTLQTTLQGLSLMILVGKHLVMVFLVSLQREVGHSDGA